MAGALAVEILLLASYAVASNLPGVVQMNGVQSNAICIDNFDWMDNSLHQSPCLVASFLLAECVGGDWTVDPTTASSHYAPPNSTTENQCQCSWAVYNTMQACASCQGVDFSTAIFSWPGWSGNCSPDLLSDSVAFPIDVTIPVETAIPFWATVDPSTWHDSIFNLTSAENLANEDKPDITQINRQASKQSKTSVGAIIGGVVGGVVFFAASTFLVILFKKRGHSPWTTLKRKHGVELMSVPYAKSNTGPVNHRYYRKLSSNPDPTLPVSVSYDHRGFAHSPYRSRPTSVSFALGVAPVAMTVQSNLTNGGTYASTARQSHAYTISDQSNVTKALLHERGPNVIPTGGLPEGAISPFALPQARMEGDDGTGTGASGSGSFAMEAAARKVKRRTPPAYSDVVRPASAGSSIQDSVEAQVAETETNSLSGTTLLQSSNIHADQDIIDDEPPAGRARGSGINRNSTERKI
ncbi:hypothetical protein M0805_009771 [Coniferiporia weirii]|nr:hypothetical protein M0805_009771 [Coniferiporia weirii]